MRSILAALSLLAALPACARAADAASAMPDPVASYTMQVRYDPATHELQGRATVTWRNTSGEPVPDLQLHLYQNAFRNLKSTYLRERMVDDAKVARQLEGHWGWMDVTSLALEDGAELKDRIEFIALDDGNADDRTVARVPLPRPVPPGGRLRFTVAFEARLPRPVDRAGWGKDFVMAAQWFPKLGVYEPAGVRGRATGGWNCHQFHAVTEFYADFGDYDVEITLPKSWKIGATGKSAGRRENPDGTASERFVQRGVHDFAWAASPRFEVHTRTFDAEQEVRPSELARAAWELDRTVDDVRLADLEVRLLAPPGERRAVDRAYRALFAAIEHFGLWYGPYPYDQLTVIIVPRDAEIIEGMEYPTLFLGSTSFYYPERSLAFENTLVHEYAHQYWYGLLANDEVEESWLDEGFCNYTTAEVMEAAYGPKLATWSWAGVRLPGVEWLSLELPWERFGLEAPEGWEKLKLPLFGVFGRPSWLSETAANRQRYLADPATDDLVRNGWDYRSDGVYWTNSYNRSATVLATLERLVGERPWARTLRAYAERHRFGHPTTGDFLAALESVTGREWDGFFDQFVWGHHRLDYAVASVSSEAIEDQPGVYTIDGRRVTRDAKGVARENAERAKRDDAKTIYRSVVEVERQGDAVWPVEVKVFFSDSTTALERWDGRYQWARFRYQRAAKVDSAVVDPEEKLLLDTNRLDNSRAGKADPTAARRWTVHWLGWVQSFLQLVGWLA